MTLKTALPAAIEIGFPPKVLKWIFKFAYSAIFLVVATAANGNPLPIALAIVTISGLIS